MRAYLLLGSNLGERLQHINEAKKKIKERCGAILVKSSMFESEPWGLKEQEYFLNCAIIIETKLTPRNLLQTLKQIEEESGRKKSEKWAARELDIDILFYGNEIINLPDLKIPHPYIS